LEHVSERPEIIIDGAHNPAGTRALAAYIRRFYSGRRIWILYGALRDKAVAEMTSILFPLADHVILTAPANSRAMPPEDIAAPGARITHSIAEGIAQLSGVPPEDVVFIAGSLYLAGEARALLVK
jgi:dihydrofolate synthase / folylpolyglutamate synthase